MCRTMYIFALLAWLAGTSSHASGIPPLQTSVCEITANPTKFEGKEVSVRGAVFAGEDITNISDASCSGMMQLAVSEGFYRHQDIQRFEKGIRTHGMHAMATVAGRFQAKAPVYPFPMPTIDMHSIRRVVYEAQRFSTP